MNAPKFNTVLITDRNSRNPVQLDHARWKIEIACPEFCALYPDIPKHWPFVEAQPTAPTCEPQSTAEPLSVKAESQTKTGDRTSDEPKGVSINVLTEHSQRADRSPAQPPAREATVTDGEMLDWLAGGDITLTNDAETAEERITYFVEWYTGGRSDREPHHAQGDSPREAITAAIRAAQNGRTTL
jgi:hypothetical protein